MFVCNHLSLHFLCIVFVHAHMCTCFCVGCIGTCMWMCFWQQRNKKPNEWSLESSPLKPGSKNNISHPLLSIHSSPGCSASFLLQSEAYLPVRWPCKFTHSNMTIPGFPGSQRHITVRGWVFLTVGPVLPCSSSNVCFTSKSSHI